MYRVVVYSKVRWYKTLRRAWLNKILHLCATELELGRFVADSSVDQRSLGNSRDHLQSGQDAPQDEAQDDADAQDLLAI